MALEYPAPAERLRIIAGNIENYWCRLAERGGFYGSLADTAKDDADGLREVATLMENNRGRT